MEDNKPFKTISELINELKQNTEKLDNGSLSFDELSMVLNMSRELHERITILKYKAAEKMVKGNESMPMSHFKLNLKKDNQLSLEEVISDAVQEKLQKAQTNFLDEIVDANEKQNEPIQPVVKVLENKFDNEESKGVNPEEKTTSPSSVNESYSSNEKSTLADKLKMTPIPDLGQAIGINLKFLLMNDLFKGENTAYNQAIETLNSCENSGEAFDCLAAFSDSLEWDEEHDSYLRFAELVTRRYL